VNVAEQVTPRKRKIFYGWWMVGAATILNFFMGGTFIYGFTVFFNPIRNTFGWGAAVTSIAFTLQRLEAGFLEVLVGFLVDKVGPRKLMLAGWSVVGLGFLLMSRVDALWSFYGAFLIIATGLNFAAFVVIFTTIANWFEKRRSRAMTVVATGFGASGTLVPLVALMVGELGWRETLTVVGVGLWLIGIPLSSLMRHKPSKYGYLPDGARSEETSKPESAPGFKSIKETAKEPARSFTVKEAVRTRAFWLLSGVAFFQFVGASAVMVHIVPYLESVNISTTMAATTVTGVTVCSLIGRLGFGFLGDFANKRYLIAIGITLQMIGIFVLSFIDMDRVWIIIPFLLTYAPGFGATMPLRPALQADYFGTDNYGTIMGLMMLVSMVGGLASPIVAGWIFDVTGSYNLAWLIYAMVTLPAIPFMLLAKPPKVEQGIS
jgi:MFS family permease